jgi:3-deoxy-D-manno-octulosonic-acid transferase
MYFWYRLFTYLFYPFAPIYLYFRKIRKKEDSISYREKLSKIEISREEGFLIWFHVASVGEAMSILPLIESCMGEKKINKILLTSITLSSGKILKKRFNQNAKVIHQFLPLDISVWTSKFLEHWKPNLSIFIDSEIWPNLISQISEKKIPLLLINARITKKSFKRWKLIISFAKKNI